MKKQYYYPAVSELLWSGVMMQEASPVADINFGDPINDSGNPNVAPEVGE